mgnify:CR=1 FL=1
MNTVERYYAAVSHHGIWPHVRGYAVFERGRLDHRGEPYCHTPGLTEREARRMVRELNDRERRIGAKVRATAGPSYLELYPDE